MRFPSPLVRGRLLKRYKRFLADVALDTGETVTATCPNTGSMLGLATPGSTVWLSRSDSQTRKYPHTWEMVEAAVAQFTHPELGIAFVGSQGDIWDAQHDMLAATCGTVIALLLIAAWSRWARQTPILAATER